MSSLLRRVMIILAVTIVPAVYWQLPQVQINVAQAAESTMKPEGLKPALSAHSLMTVTQLKGADVFAQGLSKQIDSGFSLTNSTVESHLKIYSRQIRRDLRTAAAHLREYVGTMKREPASLTSQQTLAQETHSDIAKAMDQNKALSKKLSEKSALSNPKMLKQDVSILRSSIARAISNAERLIPAR